MGDLYCLNIRNILYCIGYACLFSLQSFLEYSSISYIAALPFGEIPEEGLPVLSTSAYSLLIVSKKPTVIYSLQNGRIHNIRKVPMFAKICIRCQVIDSGNHVIEPITK